MNIIQEVFLLLFHLSSSNQANADLLDVSKCCTCVTHSSLNVYFHGITLFAYTTEESIVQLVLQATPFTERGTIWFHTKCKWA